MLALTTPGNAFAHRLADQTPISFPEPLQKHPGMEDLGLADLSAHDRISKFSATEDNLAHWVRRRPYAPIPSAIERHSALDASLGDLDKLPMELIDQILGHLSFQSILRVAQVSLTFRKIVQTLPAYREMMEHGGEVLHVLANTTLLEVHSVNNLHAVLRSEKCVSCQRFGTFLQLLNCERCCFICLLWNVSNWAITPVQARKAFKLSPRQVRSLEKLREMPKPYQTDDVDKLPRHVSVKACRQLAIEVHGSLENVRRQVLKEHLSERDFIAYSKFLRDPEGPPTQDFSVLASRTPEKFAHVEGSVATAVVRLPSLTPYGELRTPHWCMGCNLLNREARTGLLRELESQLLPKDCQHPAWIFLGMRYRARSKKDFLEHVNICPGVRKLLKRQVGKRRDSRGASM